jgi:translation initiation factor 4A
MSQSLETSTQAPTIPAVTGGGTKTDGSGTTTETGTATTDEAVLYDGNIVEYTSFDDMNLKLKLLRGIYAYGFEKPSPIQSRAIVPILSKQDVIGQAQSGTGKTGTFLISALQRIDENLKHPQALILAPTRELSQQIFGVLENLSSFMDVKSMLLIGGNSRRDDIQALNDIPRQILVGTPGRVYDMLKNMSVSSKDFKMFILDEADEMLSRGFEDQIYEIFQYIPRTCQTVLMSATMPPEALKMTEKFMEEPIKILVQNEELTLEGIRQFFISIDKEAWKLETLIDIYSKISIAQSIIYCNTKRTADWLVEQLKDREYAVKCIHSNMKSDERKDVMKEFREGNLRVIIATDIISRGIDVQQVSIVINYDIPPLKDVYIHRIGRSGRFGRKGVAINFVTQDDINKMKTIQTYYQTNIDEMPENIAEFL